MPSLLIQNAILDGQTVDILIENGTFTRIAPARTLPTPRPKHSTPKASSQPPPSTTPTHTPP
ncbi:MAG: hypothetical protein ACI4X9_02515 [Kiritimatiellia bacterium]